MLCFSEDVFLSFAISLSNPAFSVSFSTVSELFCGEFLETFVILCALLLPIKLPVTTAVLWIAIFESVLSASVAN